MDMFIEKIVRRRKSLLDMAYTSFIITVALILSFLAFVMIPSISPLIIMGVGYLAYFLASKRNIEYEYAVTNGDLDVDIIFSQKKRKRVFSANCKEFDIVASMNSDQHTKGLLENKTVEDYTSRNPLANRWYISLKHAGKEKIILFEPSEQILDSFKVFIPRKVIKS